MTACKPGGVNAQYNLAPPDALSIRVATQVRTRMFRAFMQEFSPTQLDTVLDVGVTSDQAYTSSNYFEALYPHKAQVTAAGLDEAGFLEELYPGMRFVHADALDLPFADGSFDLVHASAVLEHVGSVENQARMVAECLRVARRGVCLTTPNRWFPIEFHTQIPLIHWLPKAWYRAIFRRAGYAFFADESKLNLLTRAELDRIVRRCRNVRHRFQPVRLLGWPSNIVLMAHKSDTAAH